jgi:Paraquat-inducible protein A
VVELVHVGMWPVALLGFFASITVPVLKLVGLVYLLVSVRRRKGRPPLVRHAAGWPGELGRADARAARTGGTAVQGRRPPGS